MAKLFLPRHAKTHLPGGSDPLTVGSLATWRGFRAGPTAGDIPVPSGDDVVIAYNDWENTNTSMFEEVFESAYDTGGVSSVRLLEPGVYSVFAGFDWETFADNQLYWITVLTGWVVQPTIHQTRYGWPSPGGSPYISFTRTFPPYPETVPVDAQVGEILVYGGQSSGVTRDIDGGTPMLEIIYLGPLPTGA